MIHKLFVKNAINKNLKINQTEYPQSYPEDEPNRRRPDITKVLTFKLVLILVRNGIKNFLNWCIQEY